MFWRKMFMFPAILVIASIYGSESETQLASSGSTPTEQAPTEQATTEQATTEQATTEQATTEQATIMTTMTMTMSTSISTVNFTSTAGTSTASTTFAYSPTSMSTSMEFPVTTESSFGTLVSGGSKAAYIAIGCIAGLAVFLTLTLIVFLILCKRKVKMGQDSRMEFRMISMTSSQNARITQAKEDTDTEESLQKLKSIPTAEFSEVVKKMHFNANIAFEDEFESFPTKHESSYTVAKQKHNENRNRFENIFPYDFSRVVLKQLKCDEITDYINASFINGYNRENAYIAAQGPLRNTIGDFWRMIWEYKLTAIIMLTETFEAGREKCAQYCPTALGTPMEVSDTILLTLQSQTQYAAFKVKTILLQNNDDADNQSLIVTHFHYLAWPDHGVPADKTCLIQFIQRVRKDFPYYKSPPLLVHCSAGVGRSGTFIVLDSMLQRMTMEDSFDIYAFVCEMRKKRGLMVQTEAQYSFIHDALEEFITCGDTSIAVTNIRIAMVNLSKRDSSGQSGYAAQIELLDKVSYKRTVMNCSEAEKECNMEKNRYKEHIPYNVTRICLRPSGNKGADYINASFIDGYKHRKNFIATQGPLKGTVNDFWRMVMEYKNHVVVMLCNLQEDDEESCYQYWPDEVNKSEVYGKYNVKMIKEQENEHFITRKFEIFEVRENVMPVVQGNTPGAMEVTQFHHTKWSKRRDTPSSTPVLEMINTLLRVQIRTGNHPIIVMCNNGIERTGTFTTIYSQIERIKAEQMADIFQFIKGSRFHRADMVLEEAQFRFCHQVLADYLTSVDNYANFKDL